MTRRRAARFGAIQALFQTELSGADVEAVIAEFQAHRLADLLEPLEGSGPAPAVDREWFAALTQGAWQRAGELDPMIEELLAEGWSLVRAGYLLRACLRAGAFELAARPRSRPRSSSTSTSSWHTHSSAPTRRASSTPCSIAWPRDCARKPSRVRRWPRPEPRCRASLPSSPSGSGRSPRAPPAALQLEDDAALLDPPAGMTLVLTKDAMVAGVHFLADDPPGEIAQKLLRVNLSDLAAMGAAPVGYLLALARAKALTDDWLAEFCAGLAADQRTFGIGLLGGDTVSTPGPLTLSLTALGEVPKGQALRRRGARPGDDLWVSGALGDAALGLLVLQGKLEPPVAARHHLIERYRLPQPRLALGQALRGLAHAAIDISDGLLADLGHILETSGIGAELWADQLPLSAAARELPGARDAALAGGDDYELLFTAPRAAARKSPPSPRTWPCRSRGSAAPMQAQG